MISLYSADNQIGVEGAKMLELALQTNNTLTSLNLFSNTGYLYVISLHSADNKVGIKGAKVLGLALQTNKTLTSLNLRCKYRLLV